MIDVSTSARYTGDCRDLLGLLPEGSVQTCVTSPPYFGLRDYGHDGQIGLEATPEEYVAKLLIVFAMVRRALRDDGTLWLNLGDSYSGSRSGPQGVTGRFNDRSVAHQRIGARPPGTRPGLTRAKGGDPKNPRKGSGWNDAPNRRPLPGLKYKDLIGIPWLVAFALRADGWHLRSDIIWNKPNPMPESVADRPTKSHEYVFLLSKSERYHYDANAIAEPATFGDHKRRGTPTGGVHAPGQPAQSGISHRRTEGADAYERGTRNARSVWTIATQPYNGAHFATMPPRLAERCILAGSRPGDLVLDPFFGSGTTGMIAEKHGRRWIGFDLGYEQIANERTAQRSLPGTGTP